MIRSALALSSGPSRQLRSAPAISHWASAQRFLSAEAGSTDASSNDSFFRSAPEGSLPSFLPYCLFFLSFVASLFLFLVDFDLFVTNMAGLVYGRISGRAQSILAKNMLKTDLIHHLEGCHLSFHDIKFEYNRVFFLNSVYCPFLVFLFCKHCRLKED